MKPPLSGGAPGQHVFVDAAAEDVDAELLDGNPFAKGQDRWRFGDAREPVRK